MEASFAEADLADFRQQAFEVVLAQVAAVLHALAIQHVSLDRELAQDGSGPLAELRGAHRVDPIADRDDGIEVVVVHASGHRAAAFLLNYPEFPEGCRWGQLFAVKDILQMFIDRPHVHAEQRSHPLLRQPDRIVLVTGLDALIARLAGEDQELDSAVADQCCRAHHRILEGAVTLTGAYSVESGRFNAEKVCLMTHFRR